MRSYNPKNCSPEEFFEKVKENFEKIVRSGFNPCSPKLIDYFRFWDEDNDMIRFNQERVNEQEKFHLYYNHSLNDYFGNIHIMGYKEIHEYSEKEKEEIGCFRIASMQESHYTGIIKKIEKATGEKMNLVGERRYRLRFVKGGKK